MLLALVLAAQAPSFSPEESKQLADGEVLVKRLEPKSGAGVAARAAAVVLAPPDKVWSVVNDCDHYFEFMPRTKKSFSMEGGQVCRTEVSMPFPFSDLWSENRISRSELDGGGKRRTWNLLRGTYKNLTGSWTVWPYTDRGREVSLVIYSIDANADVSLPDAILRSAQEGTLPDVFRAVRKRAGDARE